MREEMVDMVKRTFHGRSGAVVEVMMMDCSDSCYFCLVKEDKK